MSLSGLAADADDDFYTSFTYGELKKHELIKNDPALTRILDPSWSFEKIIDDSRYDRETFFVVFNAISAQRYMENQAPLKSGDLLYRKISKEIRANKIKNAQCGWLTAHRNLHNLILKRLLPHIFTDEKVKEIPKSVLLDEYIKFFFKPMTTIKDSKARAKGNRLGSSSTSPFSSTNYHPASLKCPDWLYEPYVNALQDEELKPMFLSLFSEMNRLERKLSRYGTMEYTQEKMREHLNEHDFVITLTNLCKILVKNQKVTTKDLAVELEESVLTPGEIKSVYLLSSSILNYLKHNALLHEQESCAPDQIWLKRDFALALGEDRDYYCKKHKPNLVKRVASKLTISYDEERSIEIEPVTLRNHVDEVWNAHCNDELRRTKRDPFDQHLERISDEISRCDIDSWYSYVDKLNNL